jgi:cysteine desulfurase
MTPIYLDHAATTPVHPDVLDAMLPFWTTQIGNPSSLHQAGQAAQGALERARAGIAAQLQVQPKEIYFTASGSESDNLALRGALWAARRIDPQKNHLITSVIEHKAVLDTALALQHDHGFALTLLPVDRYGRVSVDDVAAAIRPNTALISIMAANNEIGTLQPVDAIGALARSRGILFHSDAVQAIAAQGWNLQNRPIDLLAIAPHKFNGPKGIGILYAREGVPLHPVLTGGGQERGLRPGTQNVAFAVGAARALALAQAQRESRVAHYAALRDMLTDRILAAFPDQVLLTGHPTERLPHIAAFAFRNLSANDLLLHLDLQGICAGSGSACSVGMPKPSRILEALGLGPEWTLGGLRLSVGYGTESADIESALTALQRVLPRIRRKSA